MTPRIEPSFQELAPPLSPEERALLEASLLAEGCRDALVVWKGHDILLDGHNRLELCEQLGLEYCKVEIDLPDRDAAKVWIIRNQFARRNLAPYQRVELALTLEPLIAEQAKENQRRGGGSGISGRQISDKPRDTKREIAKVANVSHDTLAKAKVVRDRADDATKEKLRRGATTINAAYREIRRQETRAAAAARATDPGELSGKYRVIYADPPWRYGKARHLGCGDAESHYATMSVEELCALPIAEHVEHDAVLFLWSTSPMLDKAIKVIAAWGFVYKTSFVWDKVKHNFGYYNSVRHEFLLIATRGACTPDNPEQIDSVQTIERTGRHSEKPEQFRGIIETLYTYGNRVELFARKQTAGWTAWGNEVPK